MAKSKALHWQEPATVPCPQCNGSGEWAGMFSSGPCANCDGTGLVGEDGEPLDQRDLLAMMRRQRDDMQQRVAKERQRLRRMWEVPGVQQAVATDRAKQEQQARDRDADRKKQLRGMI